MHSISRVKLNIESFGLWEMAPTSHLNLVMPYRRKRFNQFGLHLQFKEVKSYIMIKDHEAIVWKDDYIIHNRDKYRGLDTSWEFQGWNALKPISPTSSTMMDEVKNCHDHQ